MAVRDQSRCHIAGRVPDPRDLLPPPPHWPFTMNPPGNGTPAEWSLVVSLWIQVRTSIKDCTCQDPSPFSTVGIQELIHSCWNPHSSKPQHSLPTRFTPETSLYTDHCCTYFNFFVVAIFIFCCDKIQIALIAI